MDFGLPPLNSPLVVQGQLAQWSKPWGNWFSQAFVLLQDMQNAGTTAQRPTKSLYVGKPYFDTSLGAQGKPIWLGKDLATWVLADGTAA